VKHLITFLFYMIVSFSCQCVLDIEVMSTGYWYVMTVAFVGDMLGFLKGQDD